MSAYASATGAPHIASLLGLRSPDSLTDLDLVDRVRDGFPPRAADRIAKWIDPDGHAISATDLVPKATYHRAVSAGRALSKEHSERLLSLARVCSETLRIYHGDLDGAREFLSGPHPMLGYRSALDLAMESTAGADVVLKLLAQAEAGVAV